MNNRVTIVSGSILAALLSACGGGGGSSSDPTPPAPLSQTQQTFESVALASNGGLHSPSWHVSFGTSATGALFFNSGSYFVTTDSSVAKSPATGPQPLILSHSSLASTLPVPNFISNRVVVNGAVYTGVMSHEISYSGANVVDNELADDGKTVIASVVATAYTVIPLTGTIATSPPELLTSVLGLLTDTFNNQSFYKPESTWQSGSAYVKAARQYASDVLYAEDCETPQTTGPATTACTGSATTLETFLPSTPNQLSDGQIGTVAGVRAWVKTAPLAGATPNYQVFYESNGKIYSGHLFKNGTQLQTVARDGTTQPVEIYLNGTAAQSVKSAVTF